MTDGASLAGLVADATALNGPVDILVNNAGGAESAPFARTDATMLRRMLALNLESVFALTGLVLPGMLERGQGRVVNIASTAALKGYPYVTAYVAAKHGVLGFTPRTGAGGRQARRHGERRLPPTPETELARAAVANIVSATGRSEDEARAELARSNPQGRLVSPGEVAAAVLYLAGPGAAAVNGAALSVSGGETG